MIELQFKDIPENGSFAGKKIVLPTPSGDKLTEIDELPMGEPDYWMDLKYLWWSFRRRPHKRTFKNAIVFTLSYIVTKLLGIKS